MAGAWYNARAGVSVSITYGNGWAAVEFCPPAHYFTRLSIAALLNSKVRSLMNSTSLFVPWELRK